MKTALGTGKTIEEAVDAALLQIGASRRNVDVKILSETAEETRVQVTVIDPESTGGFVRSAPSEAPVTAEEAERQEVARKLVDDLISKLGIKAQTAAHKAGESYVVDITGRDLGLLIGWRGETLKAIQTVTNLLASQRQGQGRIVVDVERYRQRRENTVREIAYRAARQVKMTGDPITLDPMQAFERKAIHEALQADPEVTTVSVGEEPDRRVVVEPVRAPAE